MGSRQTWPVGPGVWPVIFLLVERLFQSRYRAVSEFFDGPKYERLNLCNKRDRRKKAMKKKVLYCGAAIAVVAASALMLTASQSQSPAKYDPAIETQTTIGDGFTFAAVGDVIMPMPSSQWAEPTFQNALKPIRESDVAYGQYEGTSVQLDDFHGAYFGGPAMITQADAPADLKKMGFDAFSRATNHGMDLGLDGMLVRR